MTTFVVGEIERRKTRQTRSGPKIPAAGLFGGRLYFGFGESRDNSFGFELLDAFLPIKTRWQKMKKPSRFFQANFLRLFRPPNGLRGQT